MDQVLSCQKSHSQTWSVDIAIRQQLPTEFCRKTNLKKENTILVLKLYFPFEWLYNYNLDRLFKWHTCVDLFKLFWLLPNILITRKDPGDKIGRSNINFWILTYIWNSNVRNSFENSTLSKLERQNLTWSGPSIYLHQTCQMCRYN